MEEQEYLDRITDRLKRDMKQREAELIAEQKNRTEINDLVDFVNSILIKHGVKELITKEHIRFNAEFVGNVLRIKDKKLSQIIFDKYFPRPNRTSYYHYTSFDASKNIVKNKKIRLSNLNKRFDEGEFRTFYDEHGIDGYKIGGMTLGIDYGEKELMRKIYFFSLTGSGYDYGYNSLWTDFGEEGAGVRLEFKIIPKTLDFREIFYSTVKENNSLPMLKELSEGIQLRYGLPFTFTYISKIGAYYIKGKYQNENEFRFIIKTTSDDYNAWNFVPVITDQENAVEYIEVDFINDFADFELLSVQPGYNCSDEDILEIRNEIQASGLTAIVLPKAINEYY